MYKRQDPDDKGAAEDDEEDGRVVKALIKFDIEKLGFFDMFFVYKNGKMDMQLDFPDVYKRQVLKRYKDKVKYWMTFNEINNQKNYKYPLFGYTCSGVIFNDDPHPEQCMYQVVHHELASRNLYQDYPEF